MSKKLEEIAHIYNGTGYSNNPEGDTIPIYGTGGLMGHTSVHLYEGPAVLSGRKGSINNPIYVEGKFWNVDTIFCIKANQGVDTKWLFYNFQNTDLTKLNEATGVPSVTSKSLYKLKFNWVELPEQRRIAQILTTTDTVIEKTQAAIAKYKAIKQGMLHDLFTRGIDPATNKLRPSYQVAPELYKESKLGWIPKEWEVDRLDQIIDAVDPQPDHRTPASVENGIPYLGINDIDEFGRFDLNSCRKVSHLILAEHIKRYTIRNGDIIFGKIGTIGEPKRLYNFSHLTLSANIILIQPKQVSDYVYWLLNSQIINQQIKNSIHTTSQPAFGMEKIRALIAPICDENEQRLISKKINSIESSILAEQTYLQKLQQIKKGLMEDLLSGKKRVNIKEEAISNQ